VALNFLRVPANHANQREYMTEIIYKEESYAIIGACFEVYNEKGCGFLEPIYQECLGIKFEYQRIPAIAKPSLTLTDEHRAQLLNYLHATGFELGLLVNFGHYPGLEYECIAKTQRIKGKADFSDVSL
jgi:PD-(D/E)XK nuclease superfamily protein